jgi:hypothetical protein
MQLPFISGLNEIITLLNIRVLEPAQRLRLTTPGHRRPDDLRPVRVWCLGHPDRRRSQT